MKPKKRSSLGLRVKYDSKGRAFPCYRLMKPTSKESTAHTKAVCPYKKRPSECESVQLSEEEQAAIIARIEAKSTQAFHLAEG